MNQLFSGSTDLPTRRELHARLDQLDAPAEAKAAVAELIGLTAQAGGRIIEVGRQIVAFAFELMRQFPNITFLTIVALIINALIAAVPLLGPLLQPLLGPLVLVAALGIGACLEIGDGDLRSRVNLLTREFQGIFA